MNKEVKNNDYNSEIMVKKKSILRGEKALPNGAIF